MPLPFFRKDLFWKIESEWNALNIIYRPWKCFIQWILLTIRPKRNLSKFNNNSYNRCVVCLLINPKTGNKEMRSKVNKTPLVSFFHNQIAIIVFLCLSTKRRTTSQWSMDKANAIGGQKASDSIPRDSTFDLWPFFLFPCLLSFPLGRHTCVDHKSSLN